MSVRSLWETKSRKEGDEDEDERIGRREERREGKLSLLKVNKGCRERRVGTCCPDSKEGGL